MGAAPGVRLLSRTVALVAGLVLAVGASAGCGGGAATLTPTDDAPSGTQAAEGGEALGLEPGGATIALAAGIYRNEVVPALGFRVGEGWSARLPAAGYLVLSRAEGVLALVQVDGAFDAATGAAAALPFDLTEWLQAHPGLVSTKASSLQVDNVPARQMESRTADGARDPLELFSAGGEALALASGERAHIVVMETGLVIAAVAEEAQFDALFDQIEGVVGSMALGR